MEESTHGEKNLEWIDDSGQVIDLVEGLGLLDPYGDEGHLVEVWGTYYTMLGRQHFPELVGNKMTLLMTVYTQEELIIKLMNANDRASMQSLRTELFDFWLLQKNPPNALNFILDVTSDQRLANFVEKYASHPGV